MSRHADRDRGQARLTSPAIPDHFEEAPRASADPANAFRQGSRFAENSPMRSAVARSGTCTINGLKLGRPLAS